MESFFSNWWNADDRPDGFSEDERIAYLALMEIRKATQNDLTSPTKLSRNKIRNALQVLAGTGVIRELNDRQFEISSKLFETWVTQEWF